MKLLSYQGADGARCAARFEEVWVDVNRADSSLPADIQLLFEVEDWESRVQNAIRNAGESCRVLPESLSLLPPVPRPQKIICVGLNYADHAAETGDTVPDAPVIFNKFPTALARNEDFITIPKISAQVDYEAELVVVVGRAGRAIGEDDAMNYVAGYCCGNDVSARDWQFLPPARQWFIGKTFDGFAPIGPYLTTCEEVPDPHALDIEMRVNGEVRQRSNTCQFLFRIPALIAWVSRVCTLLPGDLIFTGTPPGVGLGMKPPVFLQPGDVCEVEIQTLGILRNTFEAASETFF